MLKFISSIACLFCFLQHTIAQQKIIAGQVIDAQTKVALKAITVILKDANHKVIAFNTTNTNGEFRITTTKELGSSYLEVNQLGYKKKKIAEVVESNNCIIALEASAILLDEIEVKSRPKIQQNGDTLAYAVNSFAKEEDRSIGDVLKRMPGIEVSESGQIKYQGKAISNFYIDGDDLLGDKYRIGTNTISHGMVKDVQVLNNHEHMKVLKNKRYSDEVAINLVIKEEAKLKLSGQAKIGGGLPGQFDMETNTILFNKKYKGLNVLQGNNVGRELAFDAKGFNSSSTFTRLGMSPINNLLSLGTVGNPPIGKEHYLFNNSASINANNLFNLRSKWQIVSNIQGVFDQSTKDFSGQTNFLSEQSNYSYSEIQESKTKQWLAAISLKATRNLESSYVENSFSFEYEKDRSDAAIQTNDVHYRLSRNHQIKGITNKLDYVPSLKNGNILQLGWLVNYGSKPQELEISPGVFPEILHENVSYQSSLQQVRVPSFFSYLNAGYRLPRGRINQYYAGSLSVDHQQLNSNIGIYDANELMMLDGDSTKNDMKWVRSAGAFQATYDYKYKNFSTQLLLPITYQITNYKDPIFLLNVSQNSILFNPSYSARYFFNKENEMTFKYDRSNSFGNIESVYRGLIIRNYRLLSNNSAGINESSSNNFQLNFKTGKTLKLLFFNAGLSYKRALSSTMLSSNVTDNSSQTELIAMDNVVQNYTLNLGFDKYLFKLASTIKINGAIEWKDYNQLFNGELIPFKYSAYTLSPSTEFKIWQKLNASYSANLGFSKTKQSNVVGNLDRDMWSIAQQIGFPFTVFSGFHVNFKARHIFNHQPGFKDLNYLFMDAFLRYRLKKWKTDIDFNITNIGNIKELNTYSVSANMESLNRYQLRGRMAVLKLVLNY